MSAFHRLLRLLLAAVLIGPLLQLGGCREDARGNLAIVLGAHSNGSVPALADAGTLLGSIRQVADNGGRLTLTTAEGSPRTSYVGDLRPAQDTGDARTDNISAAVAPFMTAYGSAKASTPEVDLLGAIGLAADSIRDAEGPKTIVVIDSGLSTASVLQFQRGILNADPQALIGQLKRTPHAMPDLTGYTVRLMGVGVLTSAPQGTVSAIPRRVLEDMWRDILVAAGATVTIVTAPGATPVTAGLPPVTVVPIDDAGPVVPTPSATPSRGEDIVFTNATLGFVGDKAEFIDPAAARTVIAQKAQQAIGGKLRLRVLGTTATCAESRKQFCKDLSQRRAELVASELRALGAQVDEVRGLGDEFGWKVPDLLANGELDPEKSALNRTVRVTRGS